MAYVHDDCVSVGAWFTFMMILNNNSKVYGVYFCISISELVHYIGKN